MKSINSIFFIIIFNFFTFCISAQEVTIIGKAESYKAQEVGLYIYDDYITSREVLIASGEINEQGEFNIKATLDKTVLAILKIENTAAHIYLEPKSTYHIILPPSESTSQSPGNIHFVAPKFERQDAGELNALIIDFNNHYDNFLEDNYTIILKNVLRVPIDSFKVKMNSLYANINNPFFQDFIRYSIASLEQMVYKNKSKLHLDYLDNRPVLYNNPAYMNFFKEFYLSYLLMFSQSKTGASLVEEINTKKDYNGIMNTLKKDISVTSDTIRELLLIKGLYEIYYNEKFEQKSIDAILKTISEKSSVPEHRKIAANIILITSRLAIGDDAPGFELLNSKNEPVSLSDFKGKYVYLDFWATWCVPCLQEMEVMAKLHQKYGDKIAFVSISIDKKETTQNDYLKKKNYQWMFLHYGNFKQVKDDYGVTSIPAYFLITPDGKLMQSPAEKPIGNIEKTFHEITKVPEKKFKVGE